MDRNTIAQSKAWPIAEARSLLERMEKKSADKKVLFQTGYGPSGLPHIGTFGEVFRTTMVRQAFSLLSDRPTELIAFSDDMDGLRKVPDNLPNAAMLEQHLGKPLTAIPDPFETHASFGEHMNARLQAFLDAFGFDYRFQSGTQCYKAGLFNDALIKVLEKHEEICAIVRPELGPERRASYSPVMPVSPTTGRVLQTGVKEVRPQSQSVVFEDEDGRLCEVPVTDGHCKMQWRADWALRWTALDVDYEISGKDLIDSVRLSSKICRTIGGQPPNSFTYELFLDEKGAKISKSKGNGLTIDEWLRYGNKESLMLFLFQHPKKAKRLYFDVIPKNVDEYQQFTANALKTEDPQKLLSNPVYHIDKTKPVEHHQPLTFNMLLNLASVVNADNPDVLWGFVKTYAPDTDPERHLYLGELIDKAVTYYQDFVLPVKTYREPTAQELAGIKEMHAWLLTTDRATPGDLLQNEIYEIGKRQGFDNLRAWFQGLYEVLLGQTSGPRFGSFVAVYGIDNTIALLEQVISQGMPANGNE